MRFVALLSFGLMPVLAQAGDPVSVIEPYDGFGAVALERSGYVAFYYGHWEGDEPLKAESFKLPDLAQEYDFGPLDGDEVIAIGWLQIEPIDDCSFNVVLSPSPEFAATTTGETLPWQPDPYDPEEDAPEAWLENQVDSLAEVQSFNRSLSWLFTVAVAKDEGFTDHRGSPRERPASNKGSQSARGAANSQNEDHAIDSCPGGSCKCTGRGGGSAEACCGAGFRPRCICRPCCTGECQKVIAFELNLHR